MIDLQLFKSNVVRLCAELDDAEYARSHGHRNDLAGSMANAKRKADWLLSELEIAEGEQLLAKQTLVKQL